jgi:hypothetical protein
VRALSNSKDGVQWPLITLLAVLVADWLPFEFFRREALQRIHHHSQAEDVCSALFLTATFGLIVISPFRFRVNRRLATISFLGGLAALIYVAALPMHG